MIRDVAYLFISDIFSSFSLMKYAGDRKRKRGLLMRFVKIEVEDIENPGCNNGNYPDFVATLEDGNTVSGTTCRCGNGCSNTTPIPKIGEEYNEWKERCDWEIYEIDSDDERFPLEESDVRIVKIAVEKMENPGCNNGNYPSFEVTTSNGETICGITCRCGNGCGGLSPLPDLGEKLNDWNNKCEERAQMYWEENEKEYEIIDDDIDYIVPEIKENDVEPETVGEMEEPAKIGKPKSFEELMSNLEKKREARKAEKSDQKKESYLHATNTDPGDR